MEEMYQDAQDGGGDRVERGQRRRTGGENVDEEELATKMLQIQSKRFYLDVKQNRRGRFIKIAEVGAGGRKSRIVMSLPASSEFRDHLTEFGEFYASLGPQPGPEEELAADGRLKSETMLRENRRYYLDLKENNRGRFLRVTQVILRGPRNVVVIPAQGLVEFRDALTKLLDEFSADDPGFASGNLPEGHQFRSENKMFYFDIGQNDRGVFMRISEVKPNYRAAITIPERAWTRFRDVFIETCQKMEGGSASGAGDGDKSGGEDADTGDGHELADELDSKVVLNGDGVGSEVD